MPNLDFDGRNTLYGTHGLHAFAAKCPPQLVRYALRYYSKPGELVLDPMVGSGTTLVEARIMGRNSIGVEIDPVARLIAKAKSTSLSDHPVAVASTEVVRRAKADIARLRMNAGSPALLRRASPPNFTNRDYWFSPRVAEALSILSYHINDVRADKETRDFLWVAFSSLILARTSVANARDITHSRHHHHKHPRRPDVLGRFVRRLSRMRDQMASFRNLCTNSGTAFAQVIQGDARKLDLGDASIDLVFTSPPYVTALDYARAHFLAVPWMRGAFGLKLDEYMATGERYIGSERGRLARRFELDQEIAELEVASRVLRQLERHSQRHAKLAQRYLLDMERVLKEAFRVVRPGRHAILVVCPSNIRRVPVPTHDIFVEIASRVGFSLRRRHVRTISERRRLLPYMWQFGDRMSTEYVLVFQRP